MQELEEKIASKTARVAVVGMGYVGLPLARRAREAGYDVIGIDKYMKDDRRREIEEEGIPVVDGFAPVAESDVVLICVPTPLTGSQQPDISFIRKAARDVAANFGDSGSPKLVVLESTSYPGTTREVLIPIFRKAKIEIGGRLRLAFAPERVDPGTGRDYRKIPRIVGGLDRESGELAGAFYRNLVESVKVVPEPEVAELAKLLENIFRAVNIALVNEMSILCRRMDINIWDVLEAAATKPFGFMPFEPGPGLGGHCIPVDPFYLAWKARKYDFYPEFIELAGKINRNMPFHVVDWVADALNREGKSVLGSRILVIGVAYKANVSDTRESPALKVMELLADRGADVRYHDSYVDGVEASGKAYRSVGLSEEELDTSDCVVILTAHDDLDIDRIASAGAPVVDTRNALGRGGF